MDGQSNSRDRNLHSQCVRIWARTYTHHSPPPMRLPRLKVFPHTWWRLWNPVGLSLRCIKCGTRQGAGCCGGWMELVLQKNLNCKKDKADHIRAACRSERTQCGKPSTESRREKDTRSRAHEDSNISSSCSFILAAVHLLRRKKLKTSRKVNY